MNRKGGGGGKMEGMIFHGATHVLHARDKMAVLFKGVHNKLGLPPSDYVAA